ncbi:hypothetical protein E5676_scaffold108G001220 [Cucumis melo var. makuwa]|uniref:Uncharacterized protein n=1 Tax=Cucumis melo var. makuwa TaxID=1194695 RepID=A0A5A7THX0_CUCMM|nr:hypothetical protein E6C27_scaffold44G004170 [Cucumis melo var. makuwa]TYK05302.1 hypothetical protein E5676_scaffold108G001220 [Cucumis melo var. makuwa]
MGKRENNNKYIIIIIGLNRFLGSGPSSSSQRKGKEKLEFPLLNRHRRPTRPKASHHLRQPPEIALAFVHHRRSPAGRYSQSVSHHKSSAIRVSRSKPSRTSCLRRVVRQVSVACAPSFQNIAASSVVDCRRSSQPEPHAHLTQSTNSRRPFSPESSACEPYSTRKLRAKSRPPPSAESLPLACSSCFTYSQPSHQSFLSRQACFLSFFACWTGWTNWSLECGISPVKENLLGPRPWDHSRPDRLRCSIGFTRDQLVPTGSQIARVWERASSGAEAELKAKARWRMTRSDHGEP